MKQRNNKSIRIFSVFLSLILCTFLLVSYAAKTGEDQPKAVTKPPSTECTPEQVALMAGAGGMGTGTMGAMGTGGMSMGAMGAGGMSMGGMGGMGTMGTGGMGGMGMMNVEDDTLIPPEAAAHSSCIEVGGKNIQ